MNAFKRVKTRNKGFIWTIFVEIFQIRALFDPNDRAIPKLNLVFRIS